MVPESYTNAVIARKIRELRADMTQKDFANLFGVSPQAVSEWEKGNKIPRMGVIEKMSMHYQVPKSYILGENNSVGILIDSQKSGFGVKLGSLRKKLGLSLSEVADFIGVHKSTIARYESGEISNIGADKLEALAAALKTTPAYLMGWEDENGNPLIGEQFTAKPSGTTLLDLMPDIDPDAPLDTLTKILALITLNGLDAEEFEKMIGLAPGTVEKWKNKTNDSYNNFIPAIAKALNTSEAYLLGTAAKPRADMQEGDFVIIGRGNFITYEKYMKLPPEGRKELDDFIAYILHKYNVRD